VCGEREKVSQKCVMVSSGKVLRRIVQFKKNQSRRNGLMWECELNWALGLRRTGMLYFCVRDDRARAKVKIKIKKLFDPSDAAWEFSDI